MMKTHWLFGRGPDKLLDFKREVDAETDCNKCVHRKVCDLDMERRCDNYECGTSVGRGCQACSHKYTRYDGKDPVPCFSCPSFEEQKEAVQASECATYLPMDCPICGRRRLELIDGGKIVRCEKCTTSSEWDGFSVSHYVDTPAVALAALAAAEVKKTP
jgi:hypothetical protein